MSFLHNPGRGPGVGMTGVVISVSFGRTIKFGPSSGNSWIVKLHVARAISPR